MSRYVRNFDEMPTGLVIDNPPNIVKREVITHPPTVPATEIQYNWQENFNNGLALCYGVMLIMFGLLLVVCGAMAFEFNAYYYSLAGPIWFGILVVFAGLFGALTQCVRKSCTVFLFLAMSLVCIVGGLAFCVVLSLGAWYDSKNNESEAWGCIYDLVNVCNAYAVNRDAMVIINAMAAFASFCVFVIGVLSMVVCLQPWVDCLRTTNPCCNPKSALCFCCCHTPDETKRAYGQPSQLYSVAGTGPYAKPQPPKPALYGQAQPYAQQPAIAPAPVVYQQAPVAYSTAPGITYTSQPAITYQ